ncbi:MFS transporter [Staphylococcus saccharolyticus]|uniref:Major facilitator family transporter n=3 Tax=Staphylococcus saccharolyticus TaxID=33028 RepID=A0A380HAQ1_9STAP|nr:MFS transporter [Staphylococcus saccharolyticus]SUM74137.1 major facilitator family transporter [Staphylococcus saccharolyticus]
MIVIMTMANYIDRGAISYAQEDIIKEFGFDTIAWGSILGYFGYGYMFGSLIGGITADKKGPKFVWIVAGTAWSLAEIAMAFAGELGMAVFGGSALAGFAFLRVLFGISEGPIFSTISKKIQTGLHQRNVAYFPDWVSLVYHSLGALITAPIVSGFLTIASWRILFVLLGIIGLVWVVIWAKVFTDYPEDNKKVSEEELREIRSTEASLNVEKTIETEKGHEKWHHFFKSPTLVGNMVGYFGFQYVNFLILTWTPK